jgi:hypothetical protein
VGPTSWWANKRLATAKYRAKREGVPFDLVAIDIISAAPIDGLCPVFSLPLVWCDRKNPMNAELDRTIPELGYVRGNISIISQRANSMKSNAKSPDELQLVVDWMRRGL